MILMKDLGTSKTEKGRRVRLGLYECGGCFNIVKVNQYDIRRKRGNKVCFNCSQKANGSKHGLSDSRLYRIWTNIKQRCFNPNNKDFDRYSKLIVPMNPVWMDDFKTFYDWSIANGYEGTFELHRVCNLNGYSNRNCVWLSKDAHINVHKALK